MATNLSTIRGSGTESLNSVSFRLDRIQDQWAQIINTFMSLISGQLNKGVSGTFTTADVPAKTVTVTKGIITSISN